MSNFQRLVNLELIRYRSKPNNLTDWHACYGKILEEVDEFWDEVRKKDNKRDLPNSLQELVQIAALCERAAEGLGLIQQANDFDYEHFNAAASARDKQAS